MFYLSLVNAFSYLLVLLSNGLRRDERSTLPRFVLASVLALVVLPLHLPDFDRYLEIFIATPDLLELISGEGDIEGLYGEPGYLLLSSFFKVFSDQFLAFRFVVVFLAVYLKLTFLRQLGAWFGLGVVAYITLFFYMDAFLLRQSLATSISGIALLALFRHEPYKFWAIGLAACTFHLSALIVLPIFFLYNLQLSQRTAAFALVAILCFGIVGMGRYLADVVIFMLGSGTYIGAKLLRYQELGVGSPVGLLRGSVLLYIALLACIIFFHRSLSTRFPAYYSMLSSTLYAIVFLVALNDFGIVADRSFRALGFLFPVLISWVPWCFVASDRKMIGLLLSFLLLFISPTMYPDDRIVFMKITQ